MGERDYLHRVDAMIIIDTEGKRVFSKYWCSDLATHKKQVQFEKDLFEKTAKKAPKPSEDSGSLLSLGSSEKDTHTSEVGDIILFHNHTILYRFDEEVSFFILGSADENEVVLSQVLTCLYETLCELLRHNLEKKTLLENFDVLLLVADEMIDDGVILETNPQNIHSEVNPYVTVDAADSALAALNSLAKVVKANI